MSNLYLHQKVMDVYTGRIGEIKKVFIENKIIMYRVKFNSYSEEFHADELRSAK
jgi:hypothetical protein